MIKKSIDTQTVNYDNQQNKRLFDVLCLVYVLSCLDYVITRMALPLGALEINPILAPVIDSFTGASIKLLIPLGVLYYLWYRKQSNPRRVYRTAVFLAVVYSLIVSWNITVYLVFLI